MVLSEYLQNQNESVQEFAERIGCSSQAVYRYLAAKRVPRPVVMRAIVAATHGAVTANDFVEQHTQACSDRSEAA